MLAIELRKTISVKNFLKHFVANRNVNHCLVKCIPGSTMLMMFHFIMRSNFIVTEDVMKKIES